MPSRRREPPAMVSAVVFDCDGLLLDTETVWDRAETDLLRAHGAAVDDALRAALIGRSVAGCVTLLVDRIGDADPAAIERELLDRVAAGLRAGAPPMPGAAALLATLAARGVPIAVASNSPRALVGAPLALAGLSRWIRAVVAADDVVQPKPHPEPYLRAFALVGAEAGTGVAFDDSVVGAAAAVAAGAFVVAVPQDEAEEPPADLVVASLEDEAVMRWAASVAVLP